MSERRRAAGILRKLRNEYPEAGCELTHRDPFSLLVATILSAQCTDQRVNLVTPEVFRRWPDAAALARADLAELERVIHSTGFFRNKARSLKAMATALVQEHGGRIPQELDALTALPGVGRKTANVLRSEAWGLPAITVDTHVARLSRRLGFTREEDPVKIEAALMALFPESDWSLAGITIIFHGRRACHARSPRCEACVVRRVCPRVGVKP